MPSYLVQQLAKRDVKRLAKDPPFFPKECKYHRVAARYKEDKWVPCPGEHLAQLDVPKGVVYGINRQTIIRRKVPCNNRANPQAWSKARPCRIRHHVKVPYAKPRLGKAF